MNIKKAKVGPYDYTVERDHDWDADKYCGVTDHARSKITLSSGLSDIQEIETLIHELSHCVDYVFNGDKMEEDQVRAMSLGWTTLLRDNKKLFQNILDKL
jgi:hypothetical protein